MKTLAVILSSFIVISCSTTENHTVSKESEPSKEIVREAEIKLRYDVSKDGVVENIRVIDRGGVKDERFVSEAMKALQKRDFNDGRKLPIKNAVMAIHFKLQE